MPASADIELRNRALIAFTALTGARDGALASLRLKHVDLAEGVVHQDAREVNTKFSKSFATWFFPVDEMHLRIVTEWVAHLRSMHWGADDPLFPATAMGLGETGGFVAVGLKRAFWSDAEPIRRIFRQAFESAGLPYFNPHTFRDMLAQLGERVCTTPEEFKAWSQNVGHEHVLTTFTSYGAVAPRRQAELMRGLAGERRGDRSNADDALIARVAAIVKSQLDAKGRDEAA